MSTTPPPTMTAPEEPLEGASKEEPKPEWIRKIEREHAVLRTLLRALESRLAMNGPLPGWTRAVAETLASLVPALQEHFAREERELSPTRIEAAFPTLASRIVDLNSEHAEILTAFSVARQECVEREDDPALPGELRADLAAAIADLRRHEVAETELLAVGRWFDLPEHR